MTPPGELHFTPAEFDRIERARKSLLTSRADLIRFCVLQGLDELESLAADQAAITAFYARPNAPEPTWAPDAFDYDEFERSS